MLWQHQLLASNFFGVGVIVVPLQYFRWAFHRHSACINWRFLIVFCSLTIFSDILLLCLIELHFLLVFGLVCIYIVVQKSRENEKNNWRIKHNRPCIEKNIIEFSVSGRVLKYSRLSSNWVSHQGKSRAEVCRTTGLPRMWHVVGSLNFWNGCVRVTWNTLVELTS